jgi:hypothetical protein
MDSQFVEYQHEILSEQYPKLVQAIGESLAYQEISHHLADLVLNQILHPVDAYEIRQRVLYGERDEL